jgi:TonB family protein
MIVAAVLAVLLAQTAASPSPAAAGQCDQDAHVVKAAIPSIEGLSQETLMQHLTTEMQVAVAADGSVKSVSVSKSSGYLDFDMAAVRAAKRTTYAPKLADCRPVDGIATFKASLAPNPPP